MISKELAQIIDDLKKQEGMAFPEAASEEQIELFEKEHKLKLPQKYKEWLLFSDGGELYLPGGVQMYGVAHKPFINLSDSNRPNDNYIVIGSLSSGDPILCEKEGERIAIYNLEDGKIEDDEVYDDYFSFLKGLYELLGIES